MIGIGIIYGVLLGSMFFLTKLLFLAHVPTLLSLIIATLVNITLLVGTLYLLDRIGVVK